MKLLFRIVVKWALLSAFACFYGVVGAGISTFYPEKLVAGFAVGSSVFFIQMLVAHILHWDEVVAEMGED